MATAKEVIAQIEANNQRYLNAAAEEDCITSIDTLNDQVIWDKDRYEIDCDHVSLVADHIEDGKSFRGKYFFLSNMYMSDIEIGDMVFPSAENAYQAMKCGSLTEAIKFTMVSPYEAKQMGRTIKLRKGWCEEMKLKAMRKVVRAKFEQEPELLYKLFDTDDIQLCEKGTGDKYWGMDWVLDKETKKFKLEGKNMLGKILTELRDDYMQSVFYREYMDRRDDTVLGTRGRKGMRTRTTEEIRFGNYEHDQFYDYAEICEMFDDDQDDA